MKEIPVNGSSRPAIVDDEDYPYLSKFTWHDHQGYPFNHNLGFMHQAIILNLPIDYWGDEPVQYAEHLGIMHLNDDKYDHRRRNLKIVPRSCIVRHQKKANAIRGRAPSSRFKGVSRNRRYWQAQISIAGKVTYLGTFRNEEDAAKAYDRKAWEVFGRCARLNFPEDYKNKTKTN